MQLLIIFLYFLLRILAALNAEYPSTIISTIPSLPKGTECSATFSANCQKEYSEHPADIFEFRYIHHIKDDLYEDLLEFEVNKERVGANKELRNINVNGVVGPNVDPQNFELYNHDTQVNQVGDSPLHFSLVFVMKTDKIGSMICTTPFSILYKWQDTNLLFHHDFSGDSSAYPLQCWTDICDRFVEATSASDDETTIEEKTGTPSTIETFPPDVSPTTDCPSAFGAYLCGASTKLPRPVAPPSPSYPLFSNLNIIP